ncbi:MAG TPA: TlpA disulfide reductase family protein [Candidatus Paceibacterota bacterium]|nr:TlpA disulfide reductase family protein [Candidatus Paceibacterota bacterium]
MTALWLKRTYWIALSLVLLAGSILALQALAPLYLGHSAPQERSGPAAPDITAVDENGHTWSSADLRDRDALVLFWVSWTDDSLATLNALDEYARLFAPHDLAVVPIGFQETTSTLREFAARYPELRLLADPAGTAGAAYNVGVVPIAMLVDRTGHIVAQRIWPLTLGDFRSFGALISD